MDNVPPSFLIPLSVAPKSPAAMLHPFVSALSVSFSMLIYFSEQCRVPVDPDTLKQLQDYIDDNNIGQEAPYFLSRSSGLGLLSTNMGL